MTWAQRLKRVFKIAIETCETGGGTRKVIARIEDPAVIKRSWPLSTTAKARGNTPSTHPRAPPPLVLARPDEVARRLITKHAR